MTKIHKVVNYDHELIKNKDFNDVYKDPDVIKMKRKEKLVDVWSNIMIGLPPAQQDTPFLQQLRWPFDFLPFRMQMCCQTIPV